MSTRATRETAISFTSTALPPAYLTPLIARGQDVSAVVSMLSASRMVSLVGPGGIGKTRLAAAVATEHHGRYRGAVAWVDLVGISDAHLVGCHVAATFGLPQHPNRKTFELLIQYIGKSSVLLVLDNCEHVVGPASQLADALLRGCPALRVVVTSRQALGVTGEKAWPVPPLSVPDPRDVMIAESGAVQLFVQRARDVVPSFALTAANADAIVRICRRLDGLPLAIELAAARVRLLTPEQIAGRLDSVFSMLTSSSHTTLPRHRTLRALIDWSYDLLTAEERLLFERLSLFIGGFTLDAAERVAAGGALHAQDVLDVLAALVDKSLVSMREWHGEARYSLLETVRQYAYDCLLKTPEAEQDELRRRHARYFAEVAEHAALELHRPTQSEWLARLEAEHENLRAALSWSVANADAELALRLCLALRDYWRVRGHISEGAHWNRLALKLPAAAPELRARVLVWAAVLARMNGDYTGFRALVTEGGKLAREIGDRVALAGALTQLGVDLRDRRELDLARETLDEAIALWRELGDAWGLSAALGTRSAIAMSVGNGALARALRQEAVDVSHAAGDPEAEARALIGLGEIARREGDYESARAFYERCLAIFREFGDVWHMGALHQNLGWVAVETGAIAEALELFREGAAFFKITGNTHGVGLCLAGMARVLHESGDPEAAAVAFACACHNSRTDNVEPVPADAASWERTRERIAHAIDAKALARANAIGEAMKPAEGIVWAEKKLESVFPRERDARTRVVPASEQPPQPAEPPRSSAAIAGADLRVRALGPLQILLGDTPLEGDAFGSSKPREMLLLLLCEPDGLTRDQVGLAFWPESSAAQVKNNFHVTLHRLRKAIEHPDWIVMAGDRYRLDPVLRVDFDAARFEGEVKAALKDANKVAKRDRLAAALELYRGDFLDGEVVGDWHLDVRDRMHRLFIDASLARGELLMAEERHADAAVVYRTLLGREPMHEEACRQLMSCYAQKGERVQAIRLYETLTVLLRDEHGTTPEAATTRLYEQLQRA